MILTTVATPLSRLKELEAVEIADSSQIVTAIGSPSRAIESRMRGQQRVLLGCAVCGLRSTAFNRYSIDFGVEPAENETSEGSWSLHLRPARTRRGIPSL